MSKIIQNNKESDDILQNKSQPQHKKHESLERFQNSEQGDLANKIQQLMTQNNIKLY